MRVPPAPVDLPGALDTLPTRRLILIGGKGGVGKTTVASLAALHFSKSRKTILFSSDPASNLSELFGMSTDSQAASRRSSATTSRRRSNSWPEERRQPAVVGGGLPALHSSHENLSIESVDGQKLYDLFLAEHESLFLEAGDRGTYLDRDEIERLFRLALPGVDELMSWLRIGDLVAANPEAIVIVDTAPTGHTLRMISSSAYFEEFVSALETMQQKHRNLVTQLTRRDVRDEIDARLADFRKKIETYRDLLLDAQTTAFVPVTLAERLVTEQTLRLISELKAASMTVPFVVMNRTAPGDCDECQERSRDAEEVATSFGQPVVRLRRFCAPVESASDLELMLLNEQPPDPPKGARGRARSSRPARASSPLPINARIIFFAGKGGVGKTSCSASVALQLADNGERVTAISIDPAHSLPRLLAGIELPDTLTVEAIDTKKEWAHFREKLGDQLQKAMSSLTPSNISLSSDEDVLSQLLDIGPPGADEIFALSRIVDLMDEPDYDRIIVDTAPTGHFLRLLELPGTAGAWVRELMRILLHYREVIHTGRLGEELLKASRALSRFDTALTDGTVAIVLVTRPEPLVAGEAKMLEQSLADRKIPLAGVIVNYATSDTSCPCAQKVRERENAIIASYERPTVIERRPAPPATAKDLRSLVPMVQTPADE